MGIEKARDLTKTILNDIEKEIHRVKLETGPADIKYQARYKVDTANHLDDLAEIRAAVLDAGSLIGTDISRVSWQKVGTRRRGRRR
jgi:hypothetical protein